MPDQHWTAHASCGGRSEELFVEGASRQRTARELCERCPVWRPCLVDALDNHIIFGVWGGLTERERRGLFRRFPDVTEWGEVVADLPFESLLEVARVACRPVPDAGRQYSNH